MKRILMVAVTLLLLMALFVLTASADVPPGQCKKLDEKGQQMKCDRQGAPAKPHCKEFTAPPWQDCERGP